MTTYAATSSRPVSDPWERRRVVPTWQYLAESEPVERHCRNHGGGCPTGLTVAQAIRAARQELAWGEMVHLHGEGFDG